MNTVALMIGDKLSDTSNGFHSVPARGRNLNGIGSGNIMAARDGNLTV